MDFFTYDKTPLFLIEQGRRLLYSPNIKTNPYGQVFPLVLSEIGIMRFSPVFRHFVCDFEVPYECEFRFDYLSVMQPVALSNMQKPSPIFNWRGLARFSFYAFIISSLIFALFSPLRSKSICLYDHTALPIPYLLNTAWMSLCHFAASSMFTVSITPYSPQ